jgi:DNA-binding MarR family transcriptional regulator
MERDGWVKLTHGTKDKRNKFYATTQKAENVEHLLSIIQTVNAELTTGLSEHEVIQFEKLLKRVRQNALDSAAKNTK